MATYSDQSDRVLGQKDGLEARPLGAAGVNVVGPGPRLDRTAARWSRPWPRPGRGSRLGCDRARDPPLFWGARPTVLQPHGGQIQSGLLVGHPARPCAPVAPVEASDDRPPDAGAKGYRAPIRASRATPPRRDGHARLGPRVGQSRHSGGAMGIIGHQGPSARPGQGIDAGRITAGLPDVPIHLTPAGATWP